MAFKIFLDLDGCITDFGKALKDLLGKDVKEDFGNDPKIWAAITQAGEKYWREMEWMPDGHQLWNALEKYKPTILTAPSRHESSVNGKKIWIRENLPPGTPFFIQQNKAAHADKDSILIDDRENNIRKWEEAGGIGILHKDTRTTLDKLQKVLGTGKEAKWVESPNRDKRVFIPTIRGGRPEKPIIPEKGPGSYKREKDIRKVIEANTMCTITDKLDSIANTLEFKGLIKKAAEIDVISNTLEAGELPHTKDRPAPIFPRESPKVKDDKDHFPIPDSNHGRQALARANQYSDVPSWYDGSLQELKDTVVKAVKSKFPGIEIEEEKFDLKK